MRNIISIALAIYFALFAIFFLGIHTFNKHYADKFGYYEHIEYEAGAYIFQEVEDCAFCDLYEKYNSFYDIHVDNHIAIGHIDFYECIQENTPNIEPVFLPLRGPPLA